MRAGVALQSNMGVLCERIPWMRGASAESVAVELTLFNYLTAFHPSDVRRWALELLTEGNAGAVHIRLGMVASKVRRDPRLRYCPRCADEMLASHGELYWMRRHQLPGVLICPLHGEPLRTSTVAPQLGNRHLYVPASLENCSLKSGSTGHDWTSPARRLLKEIANRSFEVMTASPAARTPAEWCNFYRAELGLRGLCRKNAHIDQLGLRNAYVDHFRPIFSLIPEACVGHWLESIVRKPRRIFAPLHHILLGLLLDNLPERKYHMPFGSGPWQCRNPLERHVGQAVITDCDTHLDNRKIIGVFQCKCGYKFSRSAEQGSRIRILDLGPLFEIRLRELVAIGASLRKTARTLGVDPNTVRKHSARLGLVTAWKGLHSRRRCSHIDRNAQRETWLKGRQAAPTANLRMLRSSMPAVFCWLYRHDREWLIVNSPCGKRTLERKRRIDWPNIDDVISVRVSEIAHDLRNRESPVRVTRCSIERQLGIVGWLEKRAGKLPKTHIALNTLVEPVAEFQCRRIRWAVEELVRKGIPVVSWRVRRLAGLPDSSSASVESALTTAVFERA